MGPSLTLRGGSPSQVSGKIKLSLVSNFFYTENHSHLYIFFEHPLIHLSSLSYLALPNYVQAAMQIRQKKEKQKERKSETIRTEGLWGKDMQNLNL